MRLNADILRALVQEASDAEELQQARIDEATTE